MFFCGIVQRLEIDNFPAAVTKADRYDPIFQRTFEENAQYRGFLIDCETPPESRTCRPRRSAGVARSRGCAL
jgi:hypothetical protein